MKRYPSPKLSAKIRFHYLKNSVKIEIQNNIKTQKNVNLQNGWKYSKNLKI